MMTAPAETEADSPTVRPLRLWRRHRRTLCVALALFGVSAWTTVASVSFFANKRLWIDTVEDIKDLERSYVDLLTDTQSSTSAFLDQIDGLENATAEQRGSIEQLTELQDNLARQLDSREQQIKVITEQRDRARDLIEHFERNIAGAEGLVKSVFEEKVLLRQRLAAVEEKLTRIAAEREAGRRVELRLRWQLAQLQNQMKGEVPPVDEWMKDWVVGSAEALEDLISGTGVDVELLVSRAKASEFGQGGPFELAKFDDGSLLPEVKAAPPVDDDMHRVIALRKLAASLPLSSPLDHFELTSPYGKRRDPITRDWAFHGGLDFAAAANSQILAAAPGRVLHAGPFGPYGNMVEIDHGMGVTTRYGHMKSVSVNAGDEIAFRQVVGVIGSTGRSTARHLHYEVRIDGKAQDPAKFLEAGRHLVEIFEPRRAS